MVKNNQYNINNPNYKTGQSIRILCKCSFCDNDTYRLKKSKLGFCNLKCRSEWRKMNFKEQNNPNYGKRHSNLNIGRKYSKETISKFRESQKKYMRLNNVYTYLPNIGKQEKSVLDNLEQCFNYSILRQHKVAGYFLDGYCQELNLAIEVDENKHRYSIQKDLKREQDIKDVLNCQFLRIGVLQ